METEGRISSASATPATMDVGKAAFATMKRISAHESSKTARENNDEPILLVAKGKSFLSYFYVGVCSTVLYLAPDDTVNNDAILFAQEDDLTSTSQKATPMAMEIYYHMPSRRADFQWATNAFMEKNLPNGQTIADLPPNVQQTVSQFNDLYQNVQVGDRYLLQYVPGGGMSLSLNDECLGTVGIDLSMAYQREVARLIYSVWFGEKSPFSASMREELLTPLNPPVEIPTLSLANEDDSTQHNTSIELDQEDGMFNEQELSLFDRISSMFVTNTFMESNNSSSNSSNSITEEERKLLGAMGLLQYLDGESVSSSQPQAGSSSTTTAHGSLQSTSINVLAANTSASSSDIAQPIGRWTRLRRFFVRPKTSDSHQVKKNPASNLETIIPPSPAKPPTSATEILNNELNHAVTEIEEEYKYNPILLGIGGAAFLLPHLAMLLSLPPVLLKRGAPYLPTFAGKMNTTFDLIRNHILHSQHLQQRQAQKSLRFVDLGSGDGRVVFRASREGTFTKSVGYEINPMLHIFANFRKLLTPKYWNNTQFNIRDLWKVQLHQYDVVAVYGLNPIMKRLGKKLEEELKPGSIVVSNVFEIPGWRASTKNSGTSDGGDKEETKLQGSGKGVFLYQVPECFGGSGNKETDLNTK